MEYILKYLKGSWGIYVRVNGSIESGFDPNAQFRKAGLSAVVEDPSPLLDSWAIEISKAVDYLSNHVEDNPLVLNIESIEVLHVDFQIESLKYAIVMWAAKNLGMDYISCQIKFDKVSNVYVFKLNDGNQTITL